MPQIRGWLHDIIPTDWGVDTYWITEQQKQFRAFYPLRAEFFITNVNPATKKQLLSHPQIEQVDEVSRYISIHDWEPQTVFRAQINPKHIRRTYYDIREFWGDHLFNADLSISQQFCFQTKLFPYAYVKAEIHNGRLQQWNLLENYTQMDYLPVPFRTLWLQPIFDDPHFIERQGNKITSFILRESVIDQEKESVVFETNNQKDLFCDCIDYIQHFDPDILFTRGGDTFIPILASQATKIGVGNLRLGRGTRTLRSYMQQNTRERGHSYMSYGRVYFSQHGIYLDGGRHHYDVGNSFMWKDGNIEGIHELVRLGCSDPQRIARGTIGTTLSAVQMRTAYYRNILIPARKADAEEFRPAWSMTSDVGGLVFSPKVGFHQNVTELDFLSMYPNIMVHRNISPETINCTCCAGKQPVPLTNHHICTRRPGLISLSLKHILDRRQYFKKKKSHFNYDRRQKVLKWLLVTCFGYTGYRNARFGRIEAHEAISAIGRHVLTQTHQLAVKYGLEICAGIVDSIWLKRPDERPLSLVVTEKLLKEVEKITNLPVEHASDYKWIVFLPRRHEPTIGVLNRYYGLKRDGTFKIRGIEIRQSSSPIFIKKMQHELLTLLAKARTRTEFKIQIKKAKKRLNAYLAQLETGNIPLEELMITIRPSRRPNEYLNNSRQALAARQLAQAGVKVEAGMKLNFLITDIKSHDPLRRVKIAQLLSENEYYDVQEYQKLAKRAYESLIPPEFDEKTETLDTFLISQNL